MESQREDVLKALGQFLPELVASLKRKGVLKLQPETKKLLVRMLWQDSSWFCQTGGQALRYDVTYTFEQGVG